MNIYLNEHEQDVVLKKIANQAVITKLLYFVICGLVNQGVTPVDYMQIKQAIQPRPEEEIELGRSFRFLVNAGLITFNVSGVGNA